MEIYILSTTALLITMKLLLLSSLLVLAITLLSPAASQNVDSAVRDVNGEIVMAGAPYFMVPYQTRGGMTFASFSNLTCRTYIAETFPGVELGLPVTFHPAESGYKIVREEMDLNVEFVPPDYFTACSGGSMVWRLNNIPSPGMPTPRTYLRIGGVLGSPGQLTVTNWFKIVKNGDAGSERSSYKLRFCPDVCNDCQGICGDIGSTVEYDGRRWLGFGGDDFPVIFVRWEY